MELNSESNQQVLDERAKTLKSFRHWRNKVEAMKEEEYFTLLGVPSTHVIARTIWDILQHQKFVIVKTK